MGFEQAGIKIAKEQEFGKLQVAVGQAFSPEKVERFLKLLDKANIRMRNFDAVLAARALEDAGGDSVDPAAGAWKLYQALTVSDQAQVREFYLSKVEEVDATLRHKFKKLYQYY